MALFAQPVKADGLGPSKKRGAKDERKVPQVRSPDEADASTGGLPRQSKRCEQNRPPGGFRTLTALDTGSQKKEHRKEEGEGGAGKVNWKSRTMKQAVPVRWMTLSRRVCSPGRKEPAGEGIWETKDRQRKACTTEMRNASPIPQFARAGMFHTNRGVARMFAGASSGPPLRRIAHTIGSGLLREHVRIFAVRKT